MHSNLKKCVGLAIALVGFCFASKAQADVITSNLSQTAGPTNGVSGDPGWLGQKFFTGPSAMYLDGIRARTFFGGNMFIGIFSDSSGVPGTQLGLFDINPPLINGTANVFPYTGPQMLLAANTPYWIVEGAPSGITNYGWTYTSGASTGPGSIPQNWAYSTNGNSGWTPQMGFAYMLEVNGTPLPEPASLGLVAMGAILLRRRHRD